MSQSDCLTAHYCHTDSVVRLSTTPRYSVQTLLRSHYSYSTPSHVALLVSMLSGDRSHIPLSSVDKCECQAGRVVTPAISCLPLCFTTEMIRRHSRLASVWLLLALVCAVVPCLAIAHSDTVASVASPLLCVTSSIAANASVRLQPLPPIPFLASAPPTTTPILSFDTEQRYQAIDLGFGGAFTQAAGSQFVRLPAELQSELIQAYFNRTHGHAYNIGRVPINSCDYSQLTYSYDDTPDDWTLDHFDTTAAVDSQSIIPLIQAALAVTGHNRMRLFAAPWSPPAWMKNSNQMNGSSTPCLRNDTRVYTAWALYFHKWLSVYRSFGVELWGLSIQNEPENNPPWEGCIYDATGQVRFLLDYLWPTLNTTFSHLQLMAWGQRLHTPACEVVVGLSVSDVRDSCTHRLMSPRSLCLWSVLLAGVQTDFNKDDAVRWVSDQFADPDAYSLFWGVSVHWYAGALLDQMDLLHSLYPNKRIMATESCICPDVRLDDWGRGEQYLVDIIGDLNHWSVGYTDWNLLLAQDGGPTHVGESCDSAVIARFDLQPVSLHYQPIYYAIGHASRFLPRGSRRIYSNITAPTNLTYTTWVRQAEAGPIGAEEVVVVLMNGEDAPQQLAIQAGPRYAVIEAPPHSWHSLVFPASLLAADNVDTQ